MLRFLKPLQSILLLVFFLLSTSSPVNSISLYQCRTLLSLSHSLMIRVSQLRASRGDYEGSERARRIGEKLGGGFGVWRDMGAIGWDYLRNYAWRDMNPMEMYRAVTDLNGVLNGLNELSRLKSNKDRAAWVMRNYQQIFVSARSLFGRLLQVFYKSGPLRDLVLTLQREAEGGLLKDCLELGSNDLKGCVQILKDLASQFSGGKNSGRSEL